MLSCSFFVFNFIKFSRTQAQYNDKVVELQKEGKAVAVEEVSAVVEMEEVVALIQTNSDGSFSTDGGLGSGVGAAVCPGDGQQQLITGMSNIITYFFVQMRQGDLNYVFVRCFLP